MRLLHFDDVRGLVSTNFSEDAIPPYTILSHRWNGDTEVLFEDLAVSKRDFEKKAGYRKIEFCAAQTRKDGLQYFWVDTCGIDRWNQLERAQAVNSMYRWYERASKCYVFLSDVSTGEATRSASRARPPQDDAWKTQFRTSEWFQRGWTMQELISPKVVEFFSVESQFLGDKNSLVDLIHDITLIPIAALQGKTPLREFSIAARMSWAENRATTEPEDFAYCQLGLLEVTMPLSYGEGRDKALHRLHEELKASGTAPCMIPFSKNDLFVGQGPHLASIREFLFSNKETTTTIVITGAGGTGKSQLALEAAYLTRQEFPDCSIFWIEAGSADRLDQGYSDIAKKIDIPKWNLPQTDIKQLIKHHLGVESAGRWLLILDGADNEDIRVAQEFESSSVNLIDYLPHSTHGSVIITTSSKEIEQTLRADHVIQLQDPTPDTAMAMLRTLLADSVPQSEDAEMELLVENLYCRPLAIMQASAYINMEHVTLKDYRADLLARKKGFPRTAGNTHDQNAWVIVTITSVLPALKLIHKCPLAIQYLFLAVCVGYRDVPLDLFVAPSYREKEEALKLLEAYALVTRRPAETALDLHQLVHHAVRTWCEREGWLFTRAAMRSLGNIFPYSTDHQNRNKWRRLLPHARYLLSHIGADNADKDEEVLGQLSWQVAMALLGDGQYRDAERLLERVVRMNKKTLGPNTCTPLSALGNLASAYKQVGRLEEAQKLETQVMESRKIGLGPQHPQTLTAMANLAVTFADRGQFKEAKELNMQVLKVRETVLGPDHPDTLRSKANLAGTYQEMDRFVEATQLREQVMSDCKRNPRPAASCHTSEAWVVLRVLTTTWDDSKKPTNYKSS